MNQSGYKKQVRNLAVSVYDLIPAPSEQLDMFEVDPISWTGGRLN